MATFFQLNSIYAARAGQPEGRERTRFYCTEVTTDPATGKPRAYGWHGRLRTADGVWVWTPNPRTFDDWDGGVWTDITGEPDSEEGVYVNAMHTEILHANEEFVARAEYLDRHGDTWRFLGGIKELQHVKRADEKTPQTGQSIIRHCEDAALIVRDFGPMTKVEATR